jgi:hypothetical protein
MSASENRQIADRLEEAARLLRDQGADAYRVDRLRLPTEQQFTVITASRGELHGRRIVAGRERESAATARTATAA